MKKERQLWFVTRPERDPAFHLEALKALKDSVGDFPAKWKGDREAHKKYEKVLGDKGFKRKNISRDGSGGRTWAAMLRMYNYVYLMDGYLHLTKVGQALLNGDNVRENIIKQILNLQIPNNYFLSSRFTPKFDKSFEIRPARFLIRLVLEDELSNYVTKEEIIYFCLSAKKDEYLNKVKDDILNFRKSSDIEKEKIKTSIATEYDTRQRADFIQRDFESSYSDIANTFMIMIDYTSLATYVRGQDLRITPDQKDNTKKVIDLYENRYPFNRRYKLSLESFAENAGLDVTTFKANPYYNIGPATRSSKNLLKANKLLSDYPDIGALSEEKLVKIFSQEMSTNTAEKLATKFFTGRDEIINQDFFESYLNETDNYAFESKTGEIIEAFGFKVDMRPVPSSRHNEIDNTQIEILVHIDDENVCILDAKNYKKKFNLTKNLANYMATEYIPIYQDYEGKRVRYFGYITASDFAGSNKLSWIKELSEKDPSNVPVDGMMINGKTLLSLLDYCLSNNYTKDQKKKAFLGLFTNTGYSSLIKVNI